MSDPLNVAPRRLLPLAGPMLWLPADLSPHDGMIPLGADHAAELAGEGLPTPRLDALAEELRGRLNHGRGFALLRGLGVAGDPAAPLRALAARLGTPLDPAPNTGTRHTEACDALLLRPAEPVTARLRSAAAIHNALLRTDRAALAALYAPRGEPAVPVFSNEGGVFAARWDDAALPPDHLPAALSEALGEPLAIGLRAGDILALNPFLVWADRVWTDRVSADRVSAGRAPGARAAARETPTRLDAPAFAPLR